jgi:hypothetical protein
MAAHALADGPLAMELAFAGVHALCAPMLGRLGHLGHSPTLVRPLDWRTGALRGAVCGSGCRVS